MKRRLSKAVKFDNAKPTTELLSAPALLGLSVVLKHGMEKYAADNWRKGMKWRRLIGAMLRHALEFADGIDIDHDSGLPVIDHVLCCAMFLSEYQKRGLGADDRWRPPRTSLKRRKKRDQAGSGEHQGQVATKASRRPPNVRLRVRRTSSSNRSPR